MALTPDQIKELRTSAGLSPELPSPTAPSKDVINQRLAEFDAAVGNKSEKTGFFDRGNFKESQTGIPQGGTVGSGLVKSVQSTGQALGEMGTKVLNPINKGIDKLMGQESNPLPNQEFQKGTEANDFRHAMLQPTNGREKFGKLIGDVIPFILTDGESAAMEAAIAEKGAGAVPKITEILSQIPRIGEKAPELAQKIVDIGARGAALAGQGSTIEAAQTGDLKKAAGAGALNAVIPGAESGFSAAASGLKTAGQKIAPELINSMVKPLLKDFSYGKNPGRAIAEMGITGNSLDELATKIGEARQNIGSKLSDVYKKASDFVKPNGEKITVDLTDDINKIDAAIKEAAGGGKNNQEVVNRLQNIKDGLLHEHAVDAEGNIIRTSTEPKDVSALSPEQGFDFKKKIGDMTKFTGNASDDKTVNSTLKGIYGGIKQKLNTAVKEVEPGIEKLNEQYADLTSGEIAAKYRDKIEARQNLVKVGTTVSGLASGLIAAVASGGAAIPIILSGAAGAGLEKALATPRVLTRVAKWLAEASPEEKAKLFKAVPALRGAITKIMIGND